MTTYKLQGDETFDLEVKGESFYRENIAQICGPHDEEGVDLNFEASLVHEPDNPHDPDAVRVEIQGLQVGYLPKEVAKDYKILFGRLKIPRQTVLVVDANITGGFMLDDDRDANYGVRLDFPTDQSGAEQLEAISVKLKSQKRRTSFRFALIVLGALLVLCIACILVLSIMDVTGLI